MAAHGQIQGDGKGWATDVDKENGGYDYLMFVSKPVEATRDWR